MNYYSHHIGDFNNATRHLTRIERSVYSDMIDLYYDTELPLSLDIKVLCRKLLARSDEESAAVQQVLNEFFTETNQGWHHSRCEQEISDYHTNISAKSLAGKASAAKREEERLKRLTELNNNPTDVQHLLDSVDGSVQQTVNHEPITNNQDKDKDKEQAAKPAHRKTSGPPTRGTQYPADFYPDAKGVDLADSLKISLAIEREKFADYHRSKGNVMKDWQAAWRLWARNGAQFAAVSKARSPPSRDEADRKTIDVLTGRGQQGGRERDITGEAIRIT